MYDENKIQKIEKVVCDGFGISRKELFKRRRTMFLSDARAFLFYCLNKIIGMKPYHMQKRYGFDHSTIMYHIDNVEYNMKMYSSYRKKAQEMMKEMVESFDN